MAEDCVFCKIAKGVIPSTKLYEDDDLLVFLDIAPANKGHTLVISKQHFPTLHEIDENTLNKVMAMVKKTAQALSSALGCDGYNVLMNAGKAAGQLVPHVHFHVIPRYENDGQRLGWDHVKYNDKEIDEYKDKISKFLS